MSPQEIVYHPINAADAASNYDFFNQQPMPNWKPFVPTADVITVILTALIIVVCALIYFLKVRNSKPNVAPTGYVLLVEMMMVGFENLTIELLGKKYVKITPYFITLMLYISVGNLLGLVGGISPPTSSLTVTASMGIVTFVGTIYMGFKYQRLSYLKNFCFKIKIKNKQIPVMINPLNIISEIAPLFSISMRLWGNIFAGSVVMGLLYSFIQFIFQNVNPTVLGLALGSVFGGIIAPVFHSYFDVMIGLIQAYVFVMLTYTYWSNQMQEGSETHHRKNRRNKKQIIEPNVSMELQTTNLSDHDRI